MRTRSLLLAACAAASLAGCDLAPKYHVPLTQIPVNYREAQTFVQAHPADQLRPGSWWTMFGSPTLDRLEARVDHGNQTLAAALATYDQARAYAGEAESGLYPQLIVGGQINSDRQSNRRPHRGLGQPNSYMNNVIDAQADYEIDFWDKVANSVKASREAAQASAADLALIRLTMHAELASDYVTLCGLDAQIRVLTQAVTAYRHALQLTQTRFAGQISSRIDVSRAQTQLESAQAQLTDTQSRRALLEHAIAVLIGLAPEEFSLPPEPWSLDQPQIAAGLPSTLLERRPDIASAERQVAAANATIGVARAAFYPNVSLDALYGLQDTGFNIFSLPDDFWAIGPGLALPLFEGGLRHAEEAAAIAAFRIAAANYRQTVLTALQQVEDDLALLRLLAREEAQQSGAAKSAQATVDMTTALYRDGADSFLDVAVAQTEALQAEQLSVDVRTRRMQAAIALIRDLGGGWNRRTDLPSFKAIDHDMAKPTTLAPARAG